jgi:photosystem II stability/assembly factor-like uncharacterized protein
VGEGFLYRTSDAGRNWARIPAANAPRFNDLRFLTPTRGFGVADYSQLYETSDGGLTWTHIKLSMIVRSTESLDKTNVWVLSNSALYRLSVN